MTSIIPIHSPVAICDTEGFIFGVVVEANILVTADSEAVTYRCDAYNPEFPNACVAGVNVTKGEDVVEINSRPGSEYTDFGLKINEHPAVKWAIAESERRRNPVQPAADNNTPKEGP